METSLQKYPINTDVRIWLLHELWRECGLTPEAPNLEEMSPYFDYFSTRCQRFARDGGIHICIKSHDALLGITKQILTNSTRNDLHSYLRNLRPKAGGENSRLEATLDTTADMCGGLLLMAEVGVHKFGFSGCNPLTWSGHQTLRQAVEMHFQPEKKLQPDNHRLGRLFTGRNLGYIGSMKIKWTSNIVDHLLLSDDDQTVFIFHHAGFLRYQQR